MTINDYQQNYWQNSKYSICVKDGYDNTIEEFYDNCIKQHLTHNFVQNAIAWHNMLLEYIKDDNNIFWLRKYESGSRINGIYNNRRACLVKDDKGFRFAYISNFDAQEIFNMISCSVKPDLQEFKKLMNKFEYKMHFSLSKKCEESQKAAFPNCEIDIYKFGVLNRSGWYFAHIFPVNGDYVNQKKDIKKIFPRGKIEDYKFDNNSGKYAYDLSRSLDSFEKAFVKAHFLRFVDPLNYFIVPSRKHIYKIDKAVPKQKIGEYDKLLHYVFGKYIELYSRSNYTAFLNEALVNSDVLKIDHINQNKKIVIDIGYSEKKIKIK